MRKIREVLRLRWKLRLNERATARSCKVARSTVGLYAKRARDSGLDSWEAIETVSDRELESRLFPAPPSRSTPRPIPNWSEVHTELQKK